MSPIDDELRSLFHARADVLAPAPDPLAGIERRAKRMRRNRVAAYVAGTALAVAAIGVAVPALIPDTVARQENIRPAQTPSAEPSVSPPAAAPLPAGALDPRNPWAYRGDKNVIAGTELVTLRQEWTTRHSGSTLTPLFGQVYESSKKPEIVFVATGPSDNRWGIATTSEAGWDFVYDQVLGNGSTILMAVLLGDEARRLLVLAAPSTGDISYAADGMTYESLPMTDAGVAFRGLALDSSIDAVRILDGDGDVDNPVWTGPAPDSGAADNGGPPAPSTPDNLLSWPARGEAPTAATVTAAAAAFASDVGVSPDRVQTRTLFGATSSDGQRVVVMQAWVNGDDARTFGFAWTGTGKGKSVLGYVTPKGPAVLALPFKPATQGGVGTLAVVAEPAAKRIEYAGSASAPFQGIEGGSAVLIDLGTAGGDRLRTVDATGKILYRGDVQGTLCTTANLCD